MKIPQDFTSSTSNQRKFRIFTDSNTLQGGKFNKNANAVSLVAVVSAVEDLLGERIRGEVVTTQVEISEERQVLKGPEIIRPFIHASIHINLRSPTDG